MFNKSHYTVKEIHIGVDRAIAYALLQRSANGTIDRFLTGRRLSKALTCLQSIFSCGPPGGLTPLQSHDLTFKTAAAPQLANQLIPICESGANL
jgi:hypothetical protein